MNIQLKPTEKIKKFIRSKKNYQWIVNEIIQEIEKEEIDLKRTETFQDVGMAPDYPYDEKNILLWLTPTECKEIMFAINKDEEANGWLMEYVCFECDPQIDFSIYTPHQIPIHCPQCLCPIDISDPIQWYEFYFEVYIEQIIIDDMKSKMSIIRNNKV